MANTIDHVVIVVRDLAQATADYSAAGFTVTPGGEHAEGTTHNALIPFADGSYLELITFKEPERPSAHQWWPRVAQGEGIVHYALPLGTGFEAEQDAHIWRIGCHASHSCLPQSKQHG
jgi:hypothetical protein